MPRARLAKRWNKHQKHAYASDLEDPVIEAKISTTLQPIGWEEDNDGDLLPVFGIEYAYTECQLERYKPYSYLCREKLRIKRHVSLAVLALYVFKLIRVVRPPAIHIPPVASGVASQDLPILL
jgi:hypothetical protein